MSTSNESQKPLDFDLRTRIAAAIRAVDDMRVCKLSNADVKFMADAVIRELERCLRCEDCEKEWLEDESRWIRE